jgi:hypothetical protein
MCERGYVYALLLAARGIAIGRASEARTDEFQGWSVRPRAKPGPPKDQDLEDRLRREGGGSYQARCHQAHERDASFVRRVGSVLLGRYQAPPTKRCYQAGRA